MKATSKQRTFGNELFGVKVATSKQELKEQTRYLGKPCKHGHSGVRSRAGHCVSCQHERHRVELQKKENGLGCKMIESDHLLEEKRLAKELEDISL